MVTRDVFFEGMENLVNAFPNWPIKSEDPKVMKFWYEQFEHKNDNQFRHAIKQCVRNPESRFPTIGALLAYCNEKEGDPIKPKSIEVKGTTK